MKHSRGKTLLIVYGLPLLIGGAIRIAFFISWLNSPLVKYHEAPGLDMQTLVGFGCDFYQNGGLISLYKLLISLSIFINGGSFAPEYLVFLQLIMGLGTSLLAAAICLSFYGKRWAACATGIIATLYSPALMYEGLALRETLILFVCALSLYFILKARRGRFKGFRLPLAAFFAFLPCLERISMFCFAAVFSSWIIFYMIKQFTQKGNPSLKKTFLYFIKIAIIYGISGLITISPVILHASKQGKTYWKQVMFYLETGNDFENNSAKQCKATLKPINKKDKTIPATQTKHSKIEKIVAFFKPYEVTNNVNYYFLKNQLFPLDFLIGPLFLLPLSISGLILMLIQKRLFRKEFFLFAFIISFLLPAFLYMPLARYRLGLLPVFCVSAIYPFIFIAGEWRKKTKESGLKILLLTLLYILVLYWGTPNSIPIRSEDFLVYGLAMEKQNANSQDVENCFKMAYLINPQSKSAVINLSSKLLQHGKLHDAMKVLAPAFKANPDDPKIAVNYASLLNLIAVPLEAEKILKKITPQDNPNSKTIYYFQLAESLRRQKKHKEAEAAYSISVKSANKKQLEIITAMRLENEKAAKTESQQKP